MSTFFIFLLFLVCILLSLFNYKKTSLIFGSIVILSYIVIGNGFFPAFLLQNLQFPYSQLSYNNLEKTNTIILLGAGTSKNPYTGKINPSTLAFSRIAYTAIIYHECKNYNKICHVLISGGDPLNNGKSEAKTYQEILIPLGVNSEDIQLETQSKNTYQNAKFSSYLLKKKNYGQLFLVSSGLALKRPLLYFSFFNIYPKPFASDFINIPIAKFPLGYNFAMNDFAIHEYLGILRFHIYNFFGWNKK